MQNYNSIKFIRFLFVFFLKKIFFKYYIKLSIVGDIEKVLKHPKLLFISNHTSHLDAVSIISMIPFKDTNHLFITAALDYFFSNPFISFFSKHFIKAVPVDRKDNTIDSFRLCVSLLKNMDKIWLLLFPEGTRSLDGKIHTFKKGVDILSKKTGTPILFLFIEGAHELWPKNNFFAKFGGKLKIHIGPVRPINEEDVYLDYKNWVDSIKPKMFAPQTHD